MILPKDAIAQVYVKEWQNRTHLKARLKAIRPFPIEISLKPPRSGKELLGCADEFERFVRAWQQVPEYFEVQWQVQNFRHFGEQLIPIKWLITDWENFTLVLGEDVAQAFALLRSKITYLLDKLGGQEALALVLIEHLEILERLDDETLACLVALIPQLYQGMGKGEYLRALPVVGVDTKFVEMYFGLIEAMLEAIHGGVKDEGLLAWLGCRQKPKDWLLIKPLCQQTKQALGGLPLLRLSSEVLMEYELPALAVLIVENEQSCLALPYCPNTIAVAGGGKNITWLTASWLHHKRVAYWGDIDSEGFGILSLAKQRLPSLTALMMDEKTVLKFAPKMVNEPTTSVPTPKYLTPKELELFYNMRQGLYGKTRLEQERLDSDYIKQELMAWLAT